MAADAALPVWMVWPCGAAFILGTYGLGWAIGWATRLFDPPANAFAFLAAEDPFRFTLTAAGTYELVCTRPGKWGQYFTLPDVEIRVRRLPDGPVQRLRPSFWNWAKRTNIDGDTTQQIADFVADLPGEYELTNPYTTQFTSATNCASCLPRPTKRCR